MFLVKMLQKKDSQKLGKIKVKDFTKKFLKSVAESISLMKEIITNKLGRYDLLSYFMLKYTEQKFFIFQFNKIGNKLISKWGIFDSNSYNHTALDLENGKIINLIRKTIKEQLGVDIPKGTDCCFTGDNKLCYVIEIYSERRRNDIYYYLYSENNIKVFHEDDTNILH